MGTENRTKKKGRCPPLPQITVEEIGDHIAYTWTQYGEKIC